jgi:PAS domain S-box-containing protein
MAQAKSESKNHFLNGGGEMGEMIRSYNWSDTPLGHPDQWPLSLRTTLGIVLHSAFPMFLFSGKDLICFYNDAFRPSLGVEGKHPAIGKKGKEVWTEIWDFVGPMIEGVMAKGEPVYFEDQLIGYFRNGKIEDIYWTFSYSPAYGDDGKVDGVFVTCTETTSKVQMLKSLEESEQRFRVMAESTEILIALSDETGGATYFNKAWSSFTGRSEQELLRFGWADLLHDDDKQPFLDVYLRALEMKEPFTGEFRILNREGEYRWLLAKGPVRKSSDGSFAGYISSGIDITERKIVEKQLQDSEQRVRSIVESAPFPIGVYVGREMRIALLNQSIMDVWGKGYDIVGKLYSEVLPELENQEIFEQLDKVYTTGIPFHARNQRVDLVVNGKLQPYYFNYSFTPLHDAEGKIYGVMNTAAEVTDLHLAKQMVEQSERNFRNMILQAPVAMCILTGPEHVVEIANELMLELWGKPTESVMHKPIFVGLPDAKNQGLEQVMANVYKTGETFMASEMPVMLLRKGKQETVYQNFVYEPYKDSEGTILGVLAITIDVTAQVVARQKIEEIVAARTKELELANKDLQQSNADLAQFAYIASHDLQEPLRKIMTFSQMLETSLGDNINTQARNYFNKINNSSLRMHTLIRDVLTYSELTKKEGMYAPVDLYQIIENIKADFELLIEQKKASIVFKRLPTIEAIPLQMSQLFGNLISNALKFVKKDVDPVVTITVLKPTNEELNRSALPENVEYCKIQVSDNGIGFKQEYAEQIFNIFQRLHRKSDFEGTGIGLAMCKKIALNHHGDINANGSSEEGAVFNVILPVKQNLKT